MRKSRISKIIDIFIVYLPLILLSLSILYPFYYLLINSFSDDLITTPVYFYIKNFTAINYKTVLSDRGLFHAAWITVSRTAIGSLSTVFVCGMCAFALRKRNLLFRGFFITVFTIPMFFQGGLIPTYLNLKMLGLLDTYLVYILPRLYKFFYIIIMMSAFRDVSDELEEAATIDGAGYFRIFIRIYVPVSIPVLATMILFESVDAWNEWFDTAFFTRSRNLLTLQAVLVRIIRNADFSVYQSSLQSAMEENSNNPEGIKLATMFITIFPILMVYPFLQRYFVKGIMVGSVKG
jgi:putative aldouronate transport system permease protein